jgi:hypothetical protein
MLELWLLFLIVALLAELATGVYYIIDALQARDAYAAALAAVYALTAWWITRAFFKAGYESWQRKRKAQEEAARAYAWLQREELKTRRERL